MGWLIALAVIVLLGMIPIGASLRYQPGDFRMKIRVACFSFELPDGKKKKKESQQEEKEPEKKPAGQKSASPAPKKRRRPLSDYMPLVRLGIDFLGSLRRKLRIEKLWVKIVLAGDDPCDLAVNYGKTWGGISALMGTLSQILVIQDQNVDVQCDFNGEKTLFTGRLDLTISAGRALGLVLGYGFRALKEYSIFKKRKGGAAI